MPWIDCCSAVESAVYAGHSFAPAAVGPPFTAQGPVYLMRSEYQVASVNYTQNYTVRRLTF